VGAADTKSSRLAQALAAAPDSSHSIEEHPVSEPTAADLQALQVVIDAAVAAAISPIQAELETARAAQAGDAVAAAVAEALAPVQAENDGLATKLAAAEAQVTKLEADAAEFAALLTTTAEAEAAAAAQAKIAEARAAVMSKPIAEGGLGWDEARVADRIEAMAAKTEDDWIASVADLRAMAGAVDAGSPPLRPAPLAGASALGTPPVTPPAPAQAGAKSDLEVVLGNRHNANAIAL
jgi:hypothetical protein